MAFDLNHLNNEQIASQKLMQLMQKEGAKFAENGIQIPNLQHVLKNTAQKVSKMGLSGSMDEKQLDQFLMMAFMIELKPEMGKSLGNLSFKLEMDRIEKLLKLDPEHPKSLDELKLEIFSLLKANPACENALKSDLQTTATRMAEKLHEKYFKLKPEPFNKNDDEKDENKEENKNDNDLSLSELTTMSLIGINPKNPAMVTYAPLALYHTQGNPLGAVDQNPQKEARSFLDVVASAVMEKKQEQEMENSPRSPTPFKTKPAPQ